MMVPYLPWLKPSASRQAEIEKSPADELREEIDSDGDMLVDDDERYITNTDASNPDTDNDGIIDGEEYRFWTDKYKDSLNSDLPDWLKNRYPYLTDSERRGLFQSTGDLDGDGKPNIRDSDSDNDGLPDGFEVYYELDPGDPTSNITDLSPELQKYILINSIDDSDVMEFDNEMNLNDYDSEMYGGVDFDDIMFRVAPASDPRYWRTAVYDHYYEGMWYSRNTDPLYSYTGNTLEPEVDEFKSKKKVTYSVKFNGHAIGMLPVALHTTDLFDLDPARDIRYNPIGVFESMGFVESYSFNATIFKYDPKKLISSDSPTTVSNSYIIDDSTVYDSIKDLGLNLAAGKGSDFKKASAIAKYLSSNFIYDLNSYEYNLNYKNDNLKYKYLPPYTKVLVNMLEETFRGRCIDFATAFVLMCRANDIPAQLATGFAPGDIDDPSVNERVVRTGHKHAWGEVLFDGVGWLPFEVTPSQAIYGNTTGVSSAGTDENVIEYPSGSEKDEFDDFTSGDGGGTTTSEYVDIEDLIDHPKLDSDLDGIKNAADSDDDNDGLSDRDELELGTNPFSKDTDRDDLSDLEEVNEYGTSPVNSDSDSDGLTDFYEIMTSLTNPLDDDTDGGGAEDGVELEQGGDPKDNSDDAKYMDSDYDGLTDAEEHELGTDPYNEDTDGGGADDYLEQFAGLNPVNDPEDDLKVLDSDRDRLMDAKEVELGTDRFTFDTDGGGIGDGAEYFHGYDPLDDTDDFWLKDSDGDELLNYLERELGTDINDTDTDRGGVSDGVEYYYDNDPLDDRDDGKLDTDGDGLSNKLEGRYGTDPFDADTDGDNLPDGWVDYNNNDKKDPGEFEDRDLDGREDYGLWNSGTGPGETNANYPDSDGDKLWDGLEIKFGSDPLDPDSDDDGLNDYEEVEWLTDPNDGDTDGDGLTDGLEVYNYNSNPILIDSDGDGLDDWFEVEVGSNPFSVDSDGDGEPDWNDIDFNNLPTEFDDYDFNPPTGGGGDGLVNPDPPIIRPNPDDPGYEPLPPETNEPSTVEPGSSFGAGNGGVNTNLSNIWPIIIGLILILIIGLYYINWRGQHIEELAEVAERAEKELLKIEDKREFDSIRLAIFDAYRSMQKVMQRYDFIRKPAMTPAEFEQLIAGALPISDKNLSSLTKIFEEARYSDHKLNAKTRDNAIASFRALKNELRGMPKHKQETAAAS